MGSSRKSLKLQWTHRSREDLKAIGRYIAKDNPQEARQFVTRLKERAQKIIAVPRVGRIVPELMREDIREVIEKNYRIVYRVGEKTIDVLTVFEAHRLLREIV